MPQVKILFIFTLQFSTFCDSVKLVEKAFLGESITFLEITRCLSYSNRHFLNLDYINFYFYENKTGLDKQTKHFELKREVCLK